MVVRWHRGHRMQCIAYYYTSIYTGFFVSEQPEPTIEFCRKGAISSISFHRHQDMDRFVCTFFSSVCLIVMRHYAAVLVPESEIDSFMMIWWNLFPMFGLLFVQRRLLLFRLLVGTHEISLDLRLICGSHCRQCVADDGCDCQRRCAQDTQPESCFFMYSWRRVHCRQWQTGFFLVVFLWFWV